VLENVKLEEAQELIYNVINTLPGESVPLLSAPGRMVFRDIYAAHDLPPCDKSAVDGFAVSINKEEKKNYKIIEILKPEICRTSLLNLDRPPVLLQAVRFRLELYQ
jgi:molybdopterin molybdotransferase